MSIATLWYVSIECRLGFGSHSWASQPRKNHATATFGATPFSSLMIDWLNRMLVREVKVNGAQMENTRVSSEFGVGMESKVFTNYSNDRLYHGRGICKWQ